MYGRSWSRAAMQLAATVGLVGCGAAGITGGSTQKGPTQSQVNSFMSQVTTAFSNGMNSAHSRAPAAVLFPSTIDGPDGPHVVPFAGGVPTGPGIARTLVNVQVMQRTNCTSGGNITVTGSMTGSMNDQGTGVLLLGVTETITSWQCIGGYTMDGDPYLSAAGTFSYLNGQQSTAASISFGGGFRWTGNGSGSCSVQMTALFNPDGSGHMTGQACGYPVNISY